ncbi:MAG: peptide ABC transporter permease [Gammaproteobacteria bacterium]|nr:MAG: peptide ABC transporter permease [Gammaproteobacteria bacterium]
MIKLILRQLFFVITTFFGVTLITFYLQTLAPNTGEEQQYSEYIARVFQGDLGVSSSTRTPVSEEFLAHLPASVELVVLASTLALFIGLPLGIVSAINHRKPTDLIINYTSLTAYSMPIFWWGIILIMFFSLNLGVTPVAGRLSFLFDIEPVTGFILIDTFISKEPYHMDAFKDAIHHLTLPVLVLATMPTAIIARMARQTMLETLANDYMLTAQAKGLSKFKIYWVHGLRNALIPFTNMLVLQISTLMTGAMLTEYLFSLPGIGKWILDALEKSDFQSLQGGILITTTLVIFINAIIEMLQTWLNPKRLKRTRIYNG